MSQPQFHVATSFLLPAMLIFVATTFFWPLNKLCVVTSVPCRDLAVLLFTTFCVATSKACRDTIFVVSHYFLVTASLFMLRLKLFVCSLSCRDMGFRSRPNRFFPCWNLCCDLKSMSRHYFFPSCRNLISYSQQFLLNSSSFIGRDLKSVSRLNGCLYHFCSCCS